MSADYGSAISAAQGAWMQRGAARRAKSPPQRQLASFIGHGISDRIGRHSDPRLLSQVSDSLPPSYAPFSQDETLHDRRTRCSHTAVRQPVRIHLSYGH